jgi:hypothetical protein
MIENQKYYNLKTHLGVTTADDSDKFELQLLVGIALRNELAKKAQLRNELGFKSPQILDYHAQRFGEKFNRSKVYRAIVHYIEDEVNLP